MKIDLVPGGPPKRFGGPPPDYLRTDIPLNLPPEDEPSWAKPPYRKWPQELMALALSEARKMRASDNNEKTMKEENS